MGKNNAALLYVLAEIKCELCILTDTNRSSLLRCEGCTFLPFREHYKKLAESEL